MSKDSQDPKYETLRQYGALNTAAEAIELPVTEAKIAFAATVAMPSPPRTLCRKRTATRNASRPTSARSSTSPISTNSGTTPNS